MTESKYALQGHHSYQICNYGVFAEVPPRGNAPKASKFLVSAFSIVSVFFIDYIKTPEYEYNIDSETFLFFFIDGICENNTGRKPSDPP